MSSPAQAILDACVTQAQTYIDLTGEGDAVDILDANVIKLHVPYTREARQRFTITSRPCLIFSMARAVDTNPADGDNCRSVHFYTVIAQILHTQQTLQSNDITDSIAKWEYGVRNYFGMGNLRQAADDDDGAWKVTHCFIPQVDLTDEKLFAIYDDAVAVIPIRFKSSEYHSTDGRT